MDKPTKPTNLVPRSFGGVKNNFSITLQTFGYEDNVPAIYGGDNLNYQIDATGKEFDYCEKIVDFINGMPIGKTITVDNNNKLVYANLTQDIPIATTANVGMVKPDGNTITIQDDGTISTTSVIGMLKLIYPVGSIFLSTTTICPVATLFGTWQLVGTSIITSVSSSASGSTSSTSATVSVRGNGKSLGLTDGTINAGTAYYTSGGAGTQLYPNPNSYGASNGTTVTHSAPSWTNNSSVGVTTDSSKSGLTGSVTIPSQSVSVSLSKTELTVNIFKRTT